jgi:hypothetical protein
VNACLTGTRGAGADWRHREAGREQGRWVGQLVPRSCARVFGRRHGRRIRSWAMSRANCETRVDASGRSSSGAATREVGGGGLAACCARMHARLRKPVDPRC